MTDDVISREFDESLRKATERLDRASALRRGSVLLHVQGERGDTVFIDRQSPRSTFRRTSPGQRPEGTLLEITADGKILQAVLDGQRDAFEQFLEGGLQIRGDLRYLSDVALELGLIDRPL